MTGYRAILAPGQRLDPPATPAERSLAEAAYLLGQARHNMKICYAELSRYPDARFRSLRTNRTARLYLEKAKTALTTMRIALREATAA